MKEIALSSRHKNAEKLRHEVAIQLRKIHIPPEKVVLRLLRMERLEALLEIGTDRDTNSRIYISHQADIVDLLGLRADQITYGLYNNSLRGYEFLCTEKLKNLPESIIAVYRRGPNLCNPAELVKTDGGLICLDALINSQTGLRGRECMFCFPIGKNPKMYHLANIKLVYG
jgi:hypothetical protein